MKKNNTYYGKKHIKFLEKLWGDGFLSPGGRKEVKRILKGVSLANKTVLDIGCGSGGITCSLITDYKAKKVVGIDVEEDVCNVAKRRVKNLGLENTVAILQVEPGSLPFKSSSFDIVFSKDSIVHISDKIFISKEIFRVLLPGGMFLCSDWLCAEDGEPSKKMINYLALEDLGFAMASPKKYKAALKLAGFQDIKLFNRNNWYLEKAREEVRTLSGINRNEFEKITSKKYMHNTIETWHAMITVLETGEHCPHHIRSMKPVL